MSRRSKAKTTAPLITQVPAIVIVGPMVKGMSLGADGVLVMAANSALYHFNPAAKPRLTVLTVLNRHQKHAHGYVYN